MQSIDYTRRVVIRNCCRCGTDFEADCARLVCPNCRKSEEQQQKPLSFRETQIIQYVRAAAPNKEIAYALHLSEGTVKEYMNRIFRKLNVHNRTELAVWAINNKI